VGRKCGKRGPGNSKQMLRKWKTVFSKAIAQIQCGRVDVVSFGKESIC
jgi:hypothetical protein